MIFLNIIAWVTAVCASTYLGFAFYAIVVTPSWQINHNRVRQVFTICVPLIMVSVLWLIFG